MKRFLSALALASVLAIPSVQASEPDSMPVLVHYAALVQANYEDALASAQAMQRAIREFLARPSAETQQAAQEAWRKAREYYGTTEAFRFYGGPIDDDNGPEGRINAWPMDESYVDGVEGNPNAGLINDRGFAITKASIAGQNERGGEENIATGYHAIEFLLWGQDRSETGPGERGWTDYVDGRAANADRRRQYLDVVTDLLIDDLAYLAKAWRPGSRLNYRAGFVEGGRESLRKMFVALGSLSRGELAGERLEVALNSQDQEDEHSCFSDNTHRDAVLNATGIENVWLGRYRRLDGSLLQGPALRDLVAARDPAAAERATRQIAASVAAAQAIRSPFDREIIGGRDTPGRQRIQATIDSLVQQSKDLVAAANVVGITRLTLVQP
ncbi:MAG TPA: imelysin family protein [Thiobacillaceae bacterium]|nr:imelysin family protein [Thiobacillaceae bacterium]